MCKSMHKTMGGSTHRKIGSKFFFLGHCPGLWIGGATAPPHVRLIVERIQHIPNIYDIYQWNEVHSSNITPMWKCVGHRKYKKINNIERIKHKTDIHRDFPLDPKSRLPAWILIIFVLVLEHIYTCWSINKPQSINLGLEHNRTSLDHV